MSPLLYDPSRLDERRAMCAPDGPLAPLADSIAADLETLLSRELYIPREKALLSRAGGRCEADGTQLEFDPYSPDEHRCPACGRIHTGEYHHRWWVYWYQLWLAERGVHAALLHLLRGDARFGSLARDIATRYAATYADYPNRDNVLGPTRLFFSTYLESIWMLQLCVIADLRDASGDRTTADEIRSRIAAPSAALIAQYDEGMSNRQVWNNAALMAAALLHGDRAAAERVVHAGSGVEAHLANGLLDDGTWYEGENYHLFAHRGLWYCVTLAEQGGIRLDPALVARFQEGFATPFLTALPDFTLPSRKDSQYAISLHQPRFAELCELGLARADDPQLVHALAELYREELPRGDTNRARSTADVERNLGATRLTRGDLGWRSLLHARGELPVLERVAPRSAVLHGQGISVFRRERGEVYAALDWGQSGGGHGHPDRLNILLSQGDTRWLDDMGTGSYVDPSLHWFRSTLAHNAPLIDGRSQARVDGELLAQDERGGVGWTLAAVDGIAPGVRVTRALIVTPDYLVDELRWASDAPVQLDLPVHFDGALQGADLTPAPAPAGGTGTEDGFNFLRDLCSAPLLADRAITLAAHRDGRTMRGFLCTASASRLYRASAPGQPASTARTFYFLRCNGTSGAVRAVWAWSPRVDNVAFAGERVEVALGDERHVHYQTEPHWQMELSVRGAQSGIELTGWIAGRSANPENTLEPPRESAHLHARPPVRLARNGSVAFDLGEGNYRRTDESWSDAGRPSARVVLSVDRDELVIDVDVASGPVVFVAADAVNRYDNEHPDINGHGVQLYVRTPADAGAWMIVPEEPGPAARVRPLAGWGALALRRAEWERTATGFSVRARVALPAEAAEPRNTYPFSLDLLVNETVAARERRRGQLVLSGAHGEFAYLRGDRHDPARLIPVEIAASIARPS